MKLNNVTLELSSKPFIDDSLETMEMVCRTMYRQWKNLTDQSDMISVLLWISDGSEILEYRGELSQKFEWAYWCGCANSFPVSGTKTEREKINTHYFPKKYRDDAKPRTYSWLKELIATIKRIGHEMTGKIIRVGAIFDNGPEFAISEFKYKRHKEIAQANTVFPGSFVTCSSTLNHDPQPHAAYPEGIPQDTTLGEYLGKQFKVFADDMGYDYIWLSNGMGFGTETWGITGALFDKEKFYPQKADEAAKAMLQFWKDFTRYWPGDKIETRGSNFSAGLELSTDAAPLRELYNDFTIAPPVNSPWAALNYNSGLEIAAWMSHVAELPDDRFPYRFYAHDPWFMNSPWLDRYGREPWDIYQPLSICRIDENGKAQTPNSIAILTIDDTMGQMPDQVPDEVIPHLKIALQHAPDHAGPLVWVYPFEEYSDMVRGVNKNPDIVFNEDMFIAEALQQGLPLNTVISTRNFTKVANRNTDAFIDKVLIVPVSAYNAVKEFISKGGQVIFYGSLNSAPQELCQLLNVKKEHPVTGNVFIEQEHGYDTFENGSLPMSSYIHEVFNCGGVIENVSCKNDNTVVIASAVAGEDKRVIALANKLSQNQRLGFVRSILPSAKEINSKKRCFDYGKSEDVFLVERLMRDVLACFDWQINFHAYDTSAILPRICISKSNNAFYYSIFSPETYVEISTSTPYGAPILTEMQTLIKENKALWRPGKSWHKECRCFVNQKEQSIIDSKIVMPAYPGYHQRRFYYNIKNADVVFFPPSDYHASLEAVVSTKKIGTAEILTMEPIPLEWHEGGNGKYVLVKNVTGNIYFTW